MPVLVYDVYNSLTIVYKIVNVTPEGVSHSSKQNVLLAQ